MKILIDFLKNNNFLSLLIASLLSSFQFIGHLLLALSDGNLSYDEIKVLMSSASGVQVLILFIVVYVYFKKGKVKDNNE